MNRLDLERVGSDRDRAPLRSLDFPRRIDEVPWANGQEGFLADRAPGRGLARPIHDAGGGGPISP
jgi:hypothetical protein